MFNKRDQANYVYAKWLLATGDVTAPTYYVDYGGGQRGSVNTHTHYVTVSGNQVTIGAPDFTGKAHPFSVAGSATVQSVVVNGSATYQSSYNRYVVPVKITLSNGTTPYTTNLYIGASAASEAGADSVDVEWSEGDWDIWIYPYYYDAWEEINVGLAHARLTNGKERTVRLNW